MLYSVTFNLNDEDTDYKGLHEALSQYDHAEHILDPQWLISSDDKAEEIVANLRRFFHEDGNFIVSELRGDNYDFWLDDPLRKSTNKMYKRFAVNDRTPKKSVFPLLLPLCTLVALLTAIAIIGS